MKFFETRFSSRLASSASSLPGSERFCMDQSPCCSNSCSPYSIYDVQENQQITLFNNTSEPLDLHRRSVMEYRYAPKDDILVGMIFRVLHRKKDLAFQRLLSLIDLDSLKYDNLTFGPLNDSDQNM